MDLQDVLCFIPDVYCDVRSRPAYDYYLARNRPNADTSDVLGAFPKDDWSGSRYSFDLVISFN